MVAALELANRALILEMGHIVFDGSTKGGARISVQRRRLLPPRPGATTLEWMLSSPPPFNQFEALPRIE